MKTNRLALLLLFIGIQCSLNLNAQTAKPLASEVKAGKTQKKEVLLIGTFHFHNPGADAVKVNSFDVNSAESQKELEMIAEKIKAFHPDKIYVEWEYNDQKTLTSLYDLYFKGEYSGYIKKKYTDKKSAGFYTQNEIIQLAFRAAKKTGLTKVNAIDYRMNWPADTAIAAMKAAKQDSLVNEIGMMSGAMSKEYNQKMKTMNLTSLLLDLNTDADRKRNVGFYLKTFNKGGANDNFAGAFSVSEWYRRNLYMYSQIQKQTATSDQRIMILLGAGHTAMIKQFIEAEDEFKIVELKDIL